MADRAASVCRSRPFRRQWTAYDPPLDAVTRVPLAPPTFRVMSFNTLADYLVDRDGALEGPNGWLYEWSYRGPRLVREIVAQAPDVVCLQEVDHFADFFEPELRKRGYAGVYKRRTGEHTHDGCAIFVRQAAFAIVSSHPIEFFVPGHPVLDRDNVAIAAVVEWRGGGVDPPQRLIVATTHVLFNPKRGDVKLKQLELLTRRLSELRVQQPAGDAPEPSLLPVVLCGDFNLEPFSALYEFLSTGSLRVPDLNRTMMSGQHDFDNPAAHKAKFVNENDTSRHLGTGTAQGRFDANHPHSKPSRAFRVDATASHDLGFASAYAQDPDERCTGEPKFTIFHTSSKGAVDYVWFTRDSLYCHGVLEMAPAGVLFAQRSLPTEHHASDHLSLIADLSFRSMHHQ
ncbi:hypothetical protein PybrP1_009266 [[Pythium] brassicae (nom. inval.)]|nr:hypothetical protein PybrP1_009266 [[Pythium] brassicae (nom. inval.)]